MWMNHFDCDILKKIAKFVINIEKSSLTFLSPTTVTNNDVAQPSFSSHALKESATFEQNHF